jgi:hypothetical protein
MISEFSNVFTCEGFFFPLKIKIWCSIPDSSAGIHHDSAQPLLGVTKMAHVSTGLNKTSGGK